MIRRHPLVFAALVIYLLFVGWATLNPAPPDPMSVGPFELLLAEFAKYPVTAWLTYDTVEFIANIGMFVPIGVLLTVLMGARRWWIVVLLGVVLTCAIESIQLTMPARHSDVRDLVANSLGAALGASVVLLVVVVWRTAVRRTAVRRTAVRRTAARRTAAKRVLLRIDRAAPSEPPTRRSE